MLEVRGVGQSVPGKEAISNFEAVFKESKRKVEESTAVPSEDAYQSPEYRMDLSQIPHLANNAKFSALKKWLDEFYRELQAHNYTEELSEDELRLRIILYDCLKKLLKEIIDTQDRAIQIKCIDRVYIWFGKRRKRTTKALKKELGLLKEQKPVEPIKYLTLEANRQLFDEKKRTIYPEILPAKDRLQDFVIREVRYPDRKEKAPSLPAVREEVKKEGGIEAEGNYIFYKAKKLEEQKAERLWFEKKNKEVEKKREKEEFETIVKNWGFAKSKFNENLTRKCENVNYANNFRVRTAETTARRSGTAITEAKEYEEIYNEPSSEEEEEDSYTKQAFTERSKYRGELPEIVDFRGTDFKLTNGVGILPPKTAPIKTKRNQPIKKPKELIPKATDLIPQSDKSHVDYIRKRYGSLIGEEHDNMDTAANIFVNGIKGTNSLSIYNKDVKRPYTAHDPTSLRREVPLTHRDIRDKFRVHQLKEINSIKEYLATNEIPCSMATLRRAILVPEDCQQFQMTTQNFMAPGSRLMVNPFAKKKKKKKKKAKKKAKK